MHPRWPDVKGHSEALIAGWKLSPRLISWTEVEKEVWRSMEAGR
jgi:hypothetical protein